MKRVMLNRLILFLSIITAVLVVLIIGLLLSESKPAGEQISWSTEQTAAPAQNEELLMQADFLPDRTRMGLRYEGELQRADGSVETLTERNGRPLVLLFWSSWCNDCKDYMTGELPAAIAAAEAGGADFLLVCRQGVRGDNREQAESVLQQYGLNMETLMDPDAALFTQMGLHSVPTLVFIDANGIYRNATTSYLNADEMTAVIDDLTEGETIRTERFIRTFMTENGAVPSLWRISGSRLERGNAVLSETQGLMMLYAVTIGDRTMFDLLFGYVQDAMTVNGLSAWRVADGNKADVNATLDDLRILEALIAANDRWGGYDPYITERAAALYTATVRNGELRCWAGLTDGSVASQVTLCYLDVRTLRRLVAVDERWSVVADWAEALLTAPEARLSGDFPLYWPYWSGNEGGYYGNTLNMAEAMVTVLHMVRAGLPCEETLAWLEQKIAAGPLYAAYTAEGQVVAGYAFESTAVYALIAQIGQESGRPELTRIALARMDQARCPDAPMSGAYGSLSDQTLYSFDTVQALFALYGAGY